MNVIIFENASVILHGQILRNASILVEKGHIAEILTSEKNLPDVKKINLKGNFLAPGFVDLHVHGALGHDAMEADINAWNAISRYHALGGTTSFALTTVASSWESLEKVLKLATSKPKLQGAELLGIHLEGPFLSPQKIGAHAEEYICSPSAEYWQKILKYAPCITQMTLAPELDHALHLIKNLKNHGIIPSAGHTDANEDQMMQAFRAGLRHATHLFNRMAGTDKKNPKHQKDAAKFILKNPVHAEIIADGLHVPTSLLREAWKQKGADQLILITDATAGAGLKNGSKFFVGGNIEAQIHENGARIIGNEASLAGSTIRMIDAVKWMVQQVGIPLCEAIRMASYNPAKILGLENKIGGIEIGRQANFVVFDQNFDVLQTWKHHDPIFSSLVKVKNSTILQSRTSPHLKR